MNQNIESIIQPRRGFIPIDFMELWKYKELLYFLTWRNIKIRYKQTYIGVVWAILQPVITMLVFTLLFSRFAKIPSDGVPYPIFVYAGLILWQYFAAVLIHSTQSVVGGSEMISKIYFPRVFLPASSAISYLFDILFSTILLFIMIIIYGISLRIEMLLLPLLFILTMLNAIGFGFWLSAFNVRYRDVQHAIPFVIQIWMFMTPVIYPVSFVGAEWSSVIALNPMSGVIESFRCVIFGQAPIPWQNMAMSSFVGTLVFVSGLYYFRSVERHFADVI